MKFKNLIFTILLFFTTVLAQAQSNRGPGEHNDEQRQERMDKIKNAKIAYLTDKLQLSTEQAQKFWPVYNTYEADRRQAHVRPRIMKEANLEAMSESQLREAINEMHTVRQNELNVEKQYVDKFLKVISVKQLATLYRSEREFTRVLLKKLDDQRPIGRR
ncbi:hypothetical protein [Adhaeribacter pallidiroseus]|uniref:Periplasmic heavy metal sensor n=1 Tax=Adhaeribacter pallidiroseus TaxID=2072847 RepID=A0A369QGW9_9BACT|nr:hypothetical protein [Adhaeribacter pallidiroseus]RDC64173.1 hypothetical protein AHMF7616_02784 [Adhaeribacter pallidiroseus]